MRLASDLPNYTLPAQRARALQFPPCEAAPAVGAPLAGALEGGRGEPCPYEGYEV